MNTWVTVRKGPRFTHKSNKNPYYIELSNTYSILAELSTNPIQKKQPTSIDSYFILKENITLQEKINNTVNKNITNTRNNDATIINADIELADDERNVMNKTTINHRAQVWKAYIKGVIKGALMGEYPSRHTVLTKCSNQNIWFERFVVGIDLRGLK